jgi:hypothetical protein
MSRERFNHDLLLSADDVAAMRAAFPLVADALDWPALREQFLVHERAARTAKSASRRRGITALLAVLAALWLAALEPHLDVERYGPHAVLLLTLAIAALGILGTISGNHVLIGARKEHWLHHRAAAERLRQLHFQTLVRRARAFAAAPAEAAPAMQERQATLDLVAASLAPGHSNIVDAIIEDLGDAGCWLVRETNDPDHQAASPQALAELFAAYARLRFRHQYDYATKMLSPGPGFWPPQPAGQARRINQASFALIFLVVLCHIFEVVLQSVRPVGTAWLVPTMQTISILSALTVLALRVLEAGTGAGAEVARLRNYRGEVCEFSRRFDAATDTPKRIALMERMEEASYRELRDFLTTHAEASFVM